MLADRKAHQKLERAQREAKEVFRKQVLTRIAEGAKVKPAPQQDITQIKSAMEDEDDDDDDDDEDDAFMREFRAKRLLGKSIILPSK